MRTLVGVNAVTVDGPRADSVPTGTWLERFENPMRDLAEGWRNTLVHEFTREAARLWWPRRLGRRFVKAALNQVGRLEAPIRSWQNTAYFAAQEVRLFHSLYRRDCADWYTVPNRCDTRGSARDAPDSIAAAALLSGTRILRYVCHEELIAGPRYRSNSCRCRGGEVSNLNIYQSCCDGCVGTFMGGPVHLTIIRFSACCAWDRTYILLVFTTTTCLTDGCSMRCCLETLWRCTGRGGKRVFFHASIAVLAWLAKRTDM